MAAHTERIVHYTCDMKCGRMGSGHFIPEGWMFLNLLPPQALDGRTLPPEKAIICPACTLELRRVVDFLPPKKGERE